MTFSPGPAAVCLLALTLGITPRAAVAAPAAGAWPRIGPQPSLAGAMLLKSEVERGVRGPEWLTRFLPEVNEAEADMAAPSDATSSDGRSVGPQLNALASDKIVNDKSPDVLCSGCGFRPVGQAETTIATWGSFMLAGWNNARGFCAGTAVQGFGWSVNAGQTWTDGGDPPPLPGGGRYRGDPIHAVNRASGRFYLGGLYEGGVLGSGLAVLYGHFAAGSFVIDDNRQLVVGGTNFIDKEWMAADSLSGNAYLCWTNFLGVGGNQIEFARFDANLNSLGPVQVLSLPAANGNVQGSRVAVGPDGVLDVVWYEYGFPLSTIKIRRSIDFGASFAPEVNVATFYENSYNGAPGYRRGFAPTLPGIATDASDGPHRGRVYVTWDESINFYDAAFPGSSARVSVESDNFFASANPFTVGAVLRGSAGGSPDIDYFRFSATAGQTFVLRTDSLATNVSLAARIVCASDTSASANYRFLAFNAGAEPALCWTAPVTGEYYLRITPNSATTGAYVMSTTFDAANAGDRARANRDHFVATSDDATSWNTPVRLNDNSPISDGIFPEVAVDGLGRAHCFWHDFRDDPVCGAESVEYITSSGDGGATWGANRAVSDALSFWSVNACGGANQGDYQGITAEGTRVVACWSDSRLGDPDVWTDVSDHVMSVSCGGLGPLTGGSPATTPAFITNGGSGTETLGWNVIDTAGWITGVTPSASGNQSVPALGNVSLGITLAAPADCAGAPDSVFLRGVNLLIPGEAVACTLLVQCVQPVGVGATIATGLRFDPPLPNPSRGECQLSFSLPRAGPTRLSIYAVNGARVRTLIDGEVSSGPAIVRWNGRDARGRAVAVGTYFARLEADGRRIERALVRVR